MDGQLDQAIRDLIFEVYGECYIGKLVCKTLKPCGFEVVIGLDVWEKPIHIAAELPWEKFLEFMRLELRNRHLQTTSYYTGYKIDPYDERRTYCRN